MAPSQSQDKVVSKLYEGREELLQEGAKRLGPFTMLKIQKLLRRDAKALHYYTVEINKGRTADMISSQELLDAGVKRRTVEELSKLFS